MAEIPVLVTFRTTLIGGKDPGTVVTFEQFFFSRRPNIVTADRKSSLMPPTVQVGAILMKNWPEMKELLGLECEPYSGQWTLLKALDVWALDRKIHAAGWNFFFMAA